MKNPCTCLRPIIWLFSLRAVRPTPKLEVGSIVHFKRWRGCRSWDGFPTGANVHFRGRVTRLTDMACHVSDIVWRHNFGWRQPDPEDQIQLINPKYIFRIESP